MYLDIYASVRRPYSNSAYDVRFTGDVGDATNYDFAENQQVNFLCSYQPEGVPGFAVAGSSTVTGKVWLNFSIESNLGKETFSWECDFDTLVKDTWHDIPGASECPPVCSGNGQYDKTIKWNLNVGLSPCAEPCEWQTGVSDLKMILFDTDGQASEKVGGEWPYPANDMANGGRPQGILYVRCQGDKRFAAGASVGIRINGFHRWGFVPIGTIEKTFGSGAITNGWSFSAPFESIFDNPEDYITNISLTWSQDGDQSEDCCQDEMTPPPEDPTVNPLPIEGTEEPEELVEPEEEDEPIRPEDETGGGPGEEEPPGPPAAPTETGCGCEDIYIWLGGVLDVAIRWLGTSISTLTTNVNIGLGNISKALLGLWDKINYLAGSLRVGMAITDVKARENIVYLGNLLQNALQAIYDILSAIRDALMAIGQVAEALLSILAVLEEIKTALEDLKTALDTECICEQLTRIADQLEVTCPAIVEPGVGEAPATGALARVADEAERIGELLLVAPEEEGDRPTGLIEEIRHELELGSELIAGADQVTVEVLEQRGGRVEIF